jgi:adhesin HecA-like repeat protein
VVLDSNQRSITVVAQGDLSLQAKGNLAIQADKDVDLKAKGKLSLAGQSISVDGGPSVTIQASMIDLN